MGVVRWDVKDAGQIRSNRSGQELTQKLQIYVSSLDDSLLEIKRDLPQFQRWQPHPSQASFFVDEFSADQLEHAKVWMASVRYTDTITRNPLDEPVRYSMRTETLPSATILNRRGRLILNSAGDIVQPIDKPERIRVFVFKKNLPQIAEWMTDLEDVVNSETLRIGGRDREPRSLLLRKVDFGEMQEQNDVEFYPTTFELAYRKSKWNYRYPSVGYNQRVPETSRTPGPRFGQPVNVRRPILINGQPPNEPQLLDRNGLWIPEPEPQDVVILEEEIYEQAPLGVLPLR